MLRAAFDQAVVELQGAWRWAYHYFWQPGFTPSARKRSATETIPTSAFFGYHNGGKHVVDPVKAPRLVLIGTASFLNDVVEAVDSFLKACEKDAALRARVETRLPKVLQTFTFPVKS